LKGQLLLIFFVLVGLSVIIPPLGAILLPILAPLGIVILVLNFLGH